MCRNIRPLFNFEPPATHEEIRAAALQYVRKVSGARTPSGKNAGAFDRAVDKIAASTRELIDALETSAPREKPHRRTRQGAASQPPTIRVMWADPAPPRPMDGRLIPDTSGIAHP